VERMRLRGMVKVVDGVSSHERDGSWWAWVSWILESGSRHNHELVLVRADSLRPLEPPEAYKAVPLRVLRPRWAGPEHVLTAP
jgi:hypothetical protein